jgi:hypothetical protein
MYTTRAIRQMKRWNRGRNSISEYVALHAGWVVELADFDGKYMRDLKSWW